MKSLSKKDRTPEKAYRIGIQKRFFSEKRFHAGWPDYQLFLEPFAFFNYIVYIIA